MKMKKNVTILLLKITENITFYQKLKKFQIFFEFEIGMENPIIFT
jgi:hypothetical protein